MGVLKGGIMKLTRFVVMLGAFLLLSIVAKADEYLWSYQSSNFTWTVELPMAPDFPAPPPGQSNALPLYITSFLSSSIVPGSHVASEGCTSISQAQFTQGFDDTQNLLDVTCNCPPQGPGLCGELDSTFAAVIGTGTFDYFGGNPNTPPPIATLTVTDLTTATPEPSSILLSAISLLLLVLAKRKDRPSTENLS
jgi:hypothetical protein